jgi:hypothetical protein
MKVLLFCIAALWTSATFAADKTIGFYFEGAPQPIVLTELCAGNSLSKFGDSEVRIRCPQQGQATPVIWFTVKCTNITVRRPTPGRANVYCKCSP